MNLVEILKVSVGAEHFVIGWIEHERGTYALAYKNPKSSDVAVAFMMKAAKNTRNALGGSTLSDGGYFVQYQTGDCLTWTSDEIEESRHEHG